LHRQNTELTAVCLGVRYRWKAATHAQLTPTAVPLAPRRSETAGDGRHIMELTATFKAAIRSDQISVCVAAE